MSAHVDLAPETLARLIERRSQGLADSLLLEILHVLLRQERHTMTALDNIQASVAALTAQATENATKVDALLALNADISAQLAALQAAGGASADDLAALQIKIDADTAAIKGEDEKVDAALAPPPAPAPAPAADGGQPSS